MSAILSQINDPIAEERTIRTAFSPTAPISRRDLFAGRTAQMLEIIEAVDELGQHAVVFGERGVGKTSLTKIASEVLDDVVIVRVNCTSTDSFASVWNRALGDIVYTQRREGLGFGGQPTENLTSLKQMLELSDAPDVDDVFAALRYVTEASPVVVIFDEFDRISRQEVHRDFSDVLKTLSDQTTPATIVLVGVADDVRDLVKEHASIERALAQIKMPRMSEAELGEIVTRALATIEMTVEPTALRRITQLSQGLPHYTHLLGQQAALHAWMDESQSEVRVEDVQEAIDVALRKTQESVAQLYYSATYSARENLYKQVLAACANARPDDRGFFSAAAVRESLSELLGRRMEIPQFAMHLNAFSSDRGPVLRKEGDKKKFRYRFLNPLLQPYVVMRALRDGLMTPEMLRDENPTGTLSRDSLH